MCEEVRTDGLNVAIVGGAQVADGLEVLLGGPARRQDWKGKRNLHGRHCGWVDEKIAGG